MPFKGGYPSVPYVPSDLENAGLPNLFRSELTRNLSRVFPPALGGFQNPQVLGGVVQLSHDFPGTLPELSYSLFDNQGAADVTLISSAITPPEGFYWLIDEMHILANNEPAARTMRLYITYQASTPISVTVFRQTTAAPFNTPYPVGRRLIMPPQSVLSLTIDALTAGGNLRYSLKYLQLPAGQFSPKN